MLAGISGASRIFNLVFFVVLSSVLIQGPTLPWVARRLGVDAALRMQAPFPIEPNPGSRFHRALRELTIGAGSPFAGKRIVDLGLPPDLLVILIARDDDFVIATGSTEIRAGDRLLVIAGDEAFRQVEQAL